MRMLRTPAAEHGNPQPWSIAIIKCHLVFSWEPWLWSRSSSEANSCAGIGGCYEAAYHPSLPCALVGSGGRIGTSLSLPVFLLIPQMRQRDRATKRSPPDPYHGSKNT